MTIQRLLRIVLARWWVLVLVGGALVGAAAAASALLPRQYTATTTMVIEPRATDVLGMANVNAQMMAQGHLATQIDILRSERVAAQVVRMIGVDRSPTAQQQWREATGGVGTIESYFAGLLTRNLDVKPARESSVVTLAFTGSEPRFAADVANAFASAYIATNLELRNQPSKLYATWFDEQLKTLRQESEAAQARVSAYQQKNGIVADDERLDIENARLAELSQQLSVAQAQALESRARAVVSAPEVSSVPEVSSTPVVQNLRAELLRAQSQLLQAAEHLGAAHPTRERLQAEVDGLEQRLGAELSNARTTVTTVSVVTDRRADDLRTAVAQQKARVLQLKAQRDELSTLLREADSAKRVFDVALQRLAQTRLESQNTQASAYVLTPAAVPGEPSSPKTQRNLLIAAALGLLLGLAATLLVEAADRRVRHAADVEGPLQLAVLGTLPRRSPRWRLRRSQAAGPALPVPFGAAVQGG